MTAAARHLLCPDRLARAAGGHEVPEKRVVLPASARWGRAVGRRPHCCLHRAGSPPPVPSRARSLLPTWKRLVKVPASPGSGPPSKARFRPPAPGSASAQPKD
jgi:hypothetical protein